MAMNMPQPPSAYTEPPVLPPQTPPPADGDGTPPNYPPINPGGPVDPALMTY